VRRESLSISLYEREMKEFGLFQYAHDDMDIMILRQAQDERYFKK
jgi:hypothetical protein